MQPESRSQTKPAKQTIGFGNVELVGDLENKLFSGIAEIEVKMEWLKMEWEVGN